MGECSGFDPSTCWSEQTKKFADADTADPELNLPACSRAYVYAAKDNGASYTACAVMESGLLTTLEVGACSGSEMTAQYDVNADNLPPAIAGASLPAAAPNTAYSGFLKAFDPNDDPIAWTFAVVSCPLWTNLKMKDTAVNNQKAITADNTGAVGECKITITLNDGRGGITSQNYTITQAACAATCSAAGQPNCKTAAPANSILGLGACCGAGESCYQCQAGFSWNGTTCAPVGPVCGNSLCEGSENCCSCSGDCACAGFCQSDGTCLPNLIIEMFDDTAYKDNANTTAEWTGDGEARLSVTAENNEFQVNTQINDNQDYPSAAAFPDNSFVISWMSNGQDGAGDGVYAQRFNSDGTKAGAEFQVNTFTNSDQRHPSTVAFSDNSFVISWMSDSKDGSSYGVYAQRFNADGTKAGAEFQVNTWTSGVQWHPSVVAFPNNSFVISWYSGLQDGSGDGIYAQRFNADGTPIAITAYNLSSAAQSITLDNTADTITKARLTVDQEKNGQTITHYLSANGGANWEPVSLGVEHTFANTGSDLRWKAVLTTTDPAQTPIIKGYNLSYEWDNGCGACVPDCSCAANTCIGLTCPNGCGGTCAGAKITGCPCTLTLTAKADIASVSDCLNHPSYCEWPGQFLINVWCDAAFKYVSCGGNAGTYNAGATCCTVVAGFGTVCNGAILYPWPL